MLKPFILCLFLVLQVSTVRADIDWSAAIISAFEKSGSDLSDIQKKSSTYHSADSWYRASVADVSLAGAGACAVPLSAAATLPAEFLYLMREIYNSSLGLGFLIYGNATKDDFATILGIWSEEISLTTEQLDKIYHVTERVAKDLAEDAAEEAVEYAAGKAWKQLNAQPITGIGSVASIATHESTQRAATKVISKLIAKKTGAKVAGKLSTKVAAKTGTKIAGKYAAKASTSWIPIVSGAVCGGLNMWIMNGIMKSSEQYYTQLSNFRNERYKKAKVTKGWLGVQIQDVTPQLAESFGIKKAQGALVSKVIPKSPAENAGLQIGDIIIEFNSYPIEKSVDLPPMVSMASIDEKAKLTVIRQGNTETIYFKVGMLSEEEQAR